MNDSASRSATLLKAAIRAARVGLWDWDLRTGQVSFSPEWKGLLGFADDEIPNEFSQWEQRVHPGDLPRMRELLAAYVADPWPDYRAEFRMRHRDGGWRWILAQADVERDPQGRPIRMIGSHVDISDQKRVEAELARANRALRLLSGSNQILMRAVDESDLLYQVCQLAVDVAGYDAAWVGFPDPEAPDGLRQVAQASRAGASPATGLLGADREPGALALRTGSPAVARGSPPAGPSQGAPAVAEDGQCRSVLALPLLLDQATIGVLKVCTSDPEAFDAEAIAILQELARDLAYGLGALRTRAAGERGTVERLAAEQARRESEATYRSLVTAMAEGAVFQAAGGEITAVNPAAQRILGRTPGEALGETSESSTWEAVHEDGTPFPGSEHPAMVTLRTGLPQNNVVMGVRRPDGSRVWISINSAPLVAPGATQPHAVVTTFHDITERREAAEALQARAREYRALAENTPDLIVRWDRDLTRVYANPAFCEAVGIPVEQLLGTRFGQQLDARAPGAAAMLAELADSIRGVFHSGAATRVEFPWLNPASSRVIDLRLVPERNPDGEVTTVLGIGRDVTDRKDLERQLRTLAEHSPDIILRFDLEGRYLYANGALERITGVPAPTHLGRRLGEVTGTEPWGAPPAVYQGLRRRIAEVAAGGQQQQVEVALPLADGEHRFDVRLIPERNDSGVVVSVLTVARDITEQKRAEEALRGSEQRFRQMTETIDEVFWLTDADKTEMIYLSPAYERVFGRSREAVYADPRSWLDAVHPEDRARVMEALPEQARGSYDLEYRIRLKQDVVRWIHERAFPIADAEGRPYRIAGVAEDVTVRRQLEDRLRQAQKMEAVGQLAGGIAHDFNNMLAVIQMQSSLLLESGGGTPDTRDGIREILAATERATNLTRQLLTFSRRQVTQLSDLDIGETIGTMTKLLRRILGEDITLETRFAPGLPLIRADHGMMEQVLMNLAINARDAMPSGGRLSVTLDPVQVTPARAGLHPGCAAGTYVCLAVTDTGSGIPAEALPRIFEPFFTTKEIGRGTGLGLATVFGIVEQHRGWIEVESEPQRGSTFRVYLPAGNGAAALVQPEPPRPAVPGGRETILLVEDEVPVRAVTRAALDRLGYRVLEAGSAAEAVACWEETGGRVDLLLTDLIMPGGTSGRELAQQLSARSPGLKVVYTSGYSPDLFDRLVPLEAGRVLLQKPYAPSDLAQTIRSCLDQPPGAPGS